MPSDAESTVTGLLQKPTNHINTLRLRQNGCCVADNIFRSICFCASNCILFEISLKFVHKGAIDDMPALV